MPKLEGLIFDLDGTLVDSAPDLRQAMNQTLAAHGRRAVSLEEIKSFTGDGMLAQVQRAFAATGMPLGDDESHRVSQAYVKHYREVKADPSQIYPHVVEVLQGFIDQGIKIGLCTNKHEASTLKLLQDLGLIRYFQAIAGGDTFPVRKPHPGHVMGVIERLGIAAGSCVMVGDSMNDVLAAQGGGIPCLVVTHGYGADVGHLGANGLIGGLHELQGALEVLGFGFS